MKKFLLLFAAMTFTFGVYAQDGKMPTKDHLMMKDGKMWVMKAGETTAQTTDMNLSDGSVVTVGGKITLADGNIRMLQEGEAIDWDGIVTKTDARKKDKSKMK